MKHSKHLCYGCLCSLEDRKPGTQYCYSCAEKRIKKRKDKQNELRSRIRYSSPGRFDKQTKHWDRTSIIYQYLKND